MRQASAHATDQMTRQLGQMTSAVLSHKLAQLTLDAIVSLDFSLGRIVPEHSGTMPQQNFFC